MLACGHDGIGIYHRHVGKSFYNLKHKGVTAFLHAGQPVSLQ
jgi:hypothetical protein